MVTSFRFQNYVTTGQKSLLEDSWHFFKNALMRVNIRTSHYPLDWHFDVLSILYEVKLCIQVSIMLVVTCLCALARLSLLLLKFTTYNSHLGFHSVGFQVLCFCLIKTSSHNHLFNTPSIFLGYIHPIRHIVVHLE